MTCGAPAPLFNAAAPIENPTTGPPGVSAPPIVAIITPKKPDSGPSQGAIHSFGKASARNPEPITPMPMRGNRSRNSIAPPRAPSLSSTWPRIAAMSARPATTSHRRILMASVIDRRRDI
jgi:hypothetical protein